MIPRTTGKRDYFRIDSTDRCHSTIYILIHHLLYSAQEVIGTFDSLFCPVCHTTIKGLLPFIDHDWGVDSFIWSLKHLCITFHIFDDYICTGRDILNMDRPNYIRKVALDG